MALKKREFTPESGSVDMYENEKIRNKTVRSGHFEKCMDAQRG